MTAHGTAEKAHTPTLTFNDLMKGEIRSWRWCKMWVEVVRCWQLEKTGVRSRTEEEWKTKRRQVSLEMSEAQVSSWTSFSSLLQEVSWVETQGSFVLWVRSFEGWCIIFAAISSNLFFMNSPQSVKSVHHRKQIFGSWIFELLSLPS